MNSKKKVVREMPEVKCRNRMERKLGAFMMAGLMIMSSVTVPQAAQSDVIDPNAKGSITVHKYDLTAASAAGVDTSGFAATGEKNADAESALADYAIEGVEFSYVKVSDIVTDSRNGDVQVVYSPDLALQSILGLESEDAALQKKGDDYFTMATLNKAMQTLMLDNVQGKNELEGYMSSVSATAMDLTDSNGLTQAEQLPLGLYLVVETKVPENVRFTCDPFLVSVPSTDVTGDYWFYDIDVYPKNQTDVPVLQKKVRSDEADALFEDTATASVGETLDYVLISKLPDITSKATYLSVYTFTDDLSKGLAYNQDAKIFFYDSREDAMKNNTENADAVWTLSDYTARFETSYSGSADKGSYMTVKMTKAGLDEINPARSNQYMVIAYSVEVTEDAVLGDQGNPNTVTLEWRRSSSEYSDTMQDICEVYAFGLDLTKTFSDQKGDFSKVQFVLQNESDGHYLLAEGADGQFTSAGKTDQESKATLLTPDAKGHLMLRGIEADAYLLTEVHTDKGFSLLKEPVRIVIKSTDKTITPSEAEITGTPNYTDPDSYYAASGSKVRKFVEIRANSGASAEVDGSQADMKAEADSANAMAVLSVLNSPVPVLPQTGGRGLYLITILGIALFTVGAVSSKKTKRS